MKVKFLFLFFFLFIIAQHLHAQWVQLTSNTAANLTGIHCTDANNCFAAGTTGNVRKTINGGTNWTVIGSGTFTDMAAVKMYDLNNIWIGMVNGTFRYSANGGTLWSTVTPVTTSHVIYDVFFHNATDYIAVGGSSSNQTSGGNVTITSTNGGTSWTAVNNSGVPTMFGIHCLNDTTCVAVAGAETVYKTTDGGANWVTKYSGTTATLFDVHFPTSTVGYAVGGSPTSPATGGIAKKTIDGGETWTNVTLPVPNTLYGVHFVNADTGFVVGNAGVIMKTENAGTSWVQQPSSVVTDLNKVIFLNDTVGYVSGTGGVILKTTNGGFPTGINEQVSVQNLYTLYGNPLRNEMKIQTNFEMQNANFILVNEFGQQMESRKSVSGNTISVNISQVASGIYFFRLNDGVKIISGKFIVN